MILVVDVCSEKLHYYEFVKPVVDLLESEEVLVSHYDDLETKDLERCDKVIICGTSLADNKFLDDIEKFKWLKDFDKPVLGICAGFQIFGEVFGGKMGKKLEIGFFREEFVEDFLGLSGEVEVYHLHNNYVDFPLDWRIYSGVEFAQAVRKGNFYGVLFHPEVRNKEMILRFIEL
jgi:GMP synthase (glutamine-hydrolysing)